MESVLYLYHNKYRSLEEESHRDKVPFSSHHIKGTHDQHSYPRWGWPWPPDQRSVCQVFHCTVTLSPLFLAVLLRRKSFSEAHTCMLVYTRPLGSGISASSIWKSSAREVCLLFINYLFINHVFMSAWTHFYFILCIIIQCYFIYFVVHIIPMGTL